MNIGALPQVMVATARQRGLNDVLATIVQGLAECPNTVLARVWLLGTGRTCDVCLAAAGGGGGETALHLAASAGRSTVARDYSRVTGRFHLFRHGERKIGRVAATGEPLLLTDLSGDETWVAEREWVRREPVRSIAAQPLVFRGEVLGVLALFDRAALDGDAFEWLRVFADYAAVSIANARAFEEIEALRARLEDENVYLREEVSSALRMGDFVGESPGLRKVLEQVDLVAPTDAAVLVTGESGTGKELVARAIHERSQRKSRAFIKVNCGAVPETLFESEFFGHVRGAFTGAVGDRPGRFELADRGTLLLDEVGEIPLALQAKLLRVLQEQEFERVGDTRLRRVSVRVIAATNRDLKAEVNAGRFRQDLYYRLSVFPVEVPPLRERREDIGPLARHFVRQSARRLNRPIASVPQHSLDALARHDWPGNVRELQHVVERAVILWQGGPLQFPLEDAGGTAPTPSVAVQTSSALLTPADLKRLERDSIRAALDQSGGRIFGPDGAAALLGMKPTTLASRVKAIGLGARSRV